MNRYRLSMSIEDEVIAADPYEAFRQFSDRTHEGFYGPTQVDVELIEVIPEDMIIASSD